MNIRALSLVAAVLALPAVAAPALAGVVVAGTADIFLASQPAGGTVSGYFGTDSAPDNSPVRLNVVGGATLTFSATGTTSVDANCFAGPDGGCYDDQSSFSPPPAGDTYKGPASALIGVFLDDDVTDVSMGVASLDYTDLLNRNLDSQSPLLNQIFFIGDGLTDLSAIQQFVAPAGATRLFLAAADSIGSSAGNLGALSVDFTGATAAVSDAPEPATWLMMLVGFGAVGAAVRRRGLAPAAA